MTIASITMPDPIYLVRERLISLSEVTDLVSTRVMDRTGDPLPTRPYVRLDLFGGTPIVAERLDAPRIQVHVFGDYGSEVATLAAANTVRAALVATRNYTHASGVITGIDVTSPLVLPDETHNPPLVDVTFTATVYTHP